MPVLKTALGRSVNVPFVPPAVPAPHRISEVIGYLGKFASLNTGSHWSEANFQDFFDAVANRCPDALSVLKAARDMRPDKDLKPSVAAIRLAEKRRAILEPVLSKIVNLCGEELQRACETAEAFDSIVLEFSAAKPAEDLESITRKLDLQAVMPLVTEGATDSRKMTDLAEKLLNAGRFDILAEIENIAPVLLSGFDFAGLRKAWAYGRYPDLKGLADVRDLQAEKAHHFCGKIAGFCRLAMFQAVKEGIQAGEIGAEATKAVEALAELGVHGAFERFAKYGVDRQSRTEQHAAGFAKVLEKTA